MHNHLTRRGLFKGLASAAAYAAVGNLPGLASPPQDAKAAPQNAIAPAAALKRLTEGNARYASNQPDIKDYSAGRAARAQAQYPVAAILSCADSRVAPELAFDQGPGDLFVVRVAGNYFNPDNLASLEYAVEVLNAPLIMVLGHTNCGAVNAVVKDLKKHEPLPGHIYLLVDALRPGIESALKAGGDPVEANVRHNVERLRRAQPVLQQRLTQKKIDIVGGVYDLASGHVRLL